MRQKDSRHLNLKLEDRKIKNIQFGGAGRKKLNERGIAQTFR